MGDLPEQNRYGLVFSEKPVRMSILTAMLALGLAPAG